MFTGSYPIIGLFVMAFRFKFNLKYSQKQSSLLNVMLNIISCKTSCLLTKRHYFNGKLIGCLLERLQNLDPIFELYRIDVYGVIYIPSLKSVYRPP